MGMTWHDYPGQDDASGGVESQSIKTHPDRPTPSVFASNLISGGTWFAPPIDVYVAPPSPPPTGHEPDGGIPNPT
jgi:hypothetical protein